MENATRDREHLSQAIHLLKGLEQYSDFLDKGEQIEVNKTLESINIISYNLVYIVKNGVEASKTSSDHYSGLIDKFMKNVENVEKR